MSKLSYYPNMYPEVLEAIHLMYEDDPDIEVDCYLYLSKLFNNPQAVIQLNIQAEKKLKDMDRCTNCGEKLQYYHYREPHPELEGCPYEDLYEPYCPYCDMGGIE